MPITNLTYLASPYNHPDPDIREQRYKQAIDCAASLIAQGKLVFSPIAHSHPIALRMQDSGSLGWEYWKLFDLAILGFCKEMVVLLIDGWDTSVGVSEERRTALEMNIPIHFVDVLGFLVVVEENKPCD